LLGHRAKLFNFDPHATSEPLEIFDNSTIIVVDCTHSISIRGDNYSITPDFNIIEYQSSAIAGGEEYHTHHLGGTNRHQSIVIDRMIYIIMRNKISLFLNLMVLPCRLARVPPHPPSAKFLKALTIIQIHTTKMFSA